MKNAMLGLTFVTVMLVNLSTAVAQGNREDPLNGYDELMGSHEPTYGYGAGNGTYGYDDAGQREYERQQAEREYERQQQMRSLERQYQDMRNELARIARRQWQLETYMGRLANTADNFELMCEIQDQLTDLAVRESEARQEMDAIVRDYESLNQGW